MKLFLRFKFILFCIPLIFWAGCELVVDVDVPLRERKLVVNSFFNPDSVFQARISLDKHILDDKYFTYVNNATVRIYKDNFFIEELSYKGDGLYTGESIMPEANEVYEIRVFAEGYGEVHANSFSPNVTPIDEIEIGQIIDARAEANIKIKFTDRPNEKNFYELSVFNETILMHPITGEIYKQRLRVFLQSDDPAFANDEGVYSPNLIFSDVLFDGKEITIPCKISGWYFSENVTLSFELRTIGEDYFKYMKTYNLQNYTQGNPFAQPVQVYNNIHNGFGIFAGYSVFVLEYKP